MKGGVPVFAFTDAARAIQYREEENQRRDALGGARAEVRTITLNPANVP
jgi:hypothetical protein